MLSKTNYEPVVVRFYGMPFFPAASDFDGDAKADPALFRAADNLWIIFCSSHNYASTNVIFGK